MSQAPLAAGLIAVTVVAVVAIACVIALAVMASQCTCECFEVARAPHRRHHGHPNDEPATPRTVHLVFGFWDPPSPLPDFVQEALAHWRSVGAQPRLWTPDAVQDVINRHMGADVQAAFAAASPIQKSDLARYIVVYLFGGWYADIDVRYVAPPPFVGNFKHAYPAVVFVETVLPAGKIADIGAREPPRAAGHKQSPTRIANYVFYSEAKGKYIGAVLDAAVQRTLQWSPNYASGPLPFTEYGLVLYTTGPDVTTDMWVAMPPGAAHVWHGPRLVQHLFFGKWKGAAGAVARATPHNSSGSALL